MPRFVANYRVSIDRQGRSGWGLDAQPEAVADQVARAQFGWQTWRGPLFEQR